MNPRRPFDRGEFEARLTTRLLGRRLEVHEQAVSTNDLALAAARAGAAPGSSFLAEAQLQGRGRSGARWEAPWRAAVLVSVVLPPLGGLPVGRVTLGAGIAACRTLREAGIEQAKIKWPNDVLGALGKLAGVLCEARSAAEGPGVLVAGVGINVDQGAEELPAGASSIRRETGRPGSREATLACFLGELERVMDALERDEWASLSEEWLELAPWHRGGRLRVYDGGRELRGASEGIDAQGALLVRQEDRSLLRVVSGSIRLEG